MKPVANRLRAVLTTAVAALALSSTATRVEAATTLNPADPSNFDQDGAQTATPGTVLTLTDESVSDFVLLFTYDADAGPGVDLDLIAKFQITSTAPSNATTGNRIVINDGQTKSAIAVCIVKNGVKGIGLYSHGTASDPASYPVFVGADWQTAPVTIRLRRTATGDAELVEVNGVAPSPRALLTAANAPAITRPWRTVEFGPASMEATTAVKYSSFRSERVVKIPAFPFER